MLFLRVDIPRTPHGNEMRYVLQDKKYTARVIANILGVNVAGEWPLLLADEIGEFVLLLRKARIQHLYLKEHHQGIDLLPEGVLAARAQSPLWP